VPVVNPLKTELWLISLRLSEQDRRSGVINPESVEADSQQADYILYDALVSEEILRLARTDAQCIYVGESLHPRLGRISRNGRIRLTS
jgi:hypothetical protein